MASVIVEVVGLTYPGAAVEAETGLDLEIEDGRFMVFVDPARVHLFDFAAGERLHQ